MASGFEVGAQGWRHPGWAETFYPDTLPADWRLIYYSNEFRCVLVPGAYWRARAALDRWLADTDDGFSFFLEAPADDWAGAPGFRSRVRPLAARTGGILLRLNPVALPPPRAFAEALAPWIGAGPVYVDFPGRLPDEYGRLIRQAGAGLCWRAAGTESRSGCRIGLLGPEQAAGDRRGLRGVIQAFVEQDIGGSDLVLLFEGDPPGVPAMKDAAVIASLLGR